MANNYLKNLQEQIEQLEDIVDGKDLELTILENELVDVYEPSRAISETTMLYLQIMSEVLEFIIKKGWTPAIKRSHERLLRLMELNKCLEGISTSNYNLKASNRLIFTEYQLLRVENKKLKQQLEQTISAETF